MIEWPIRTPGPSTRPMLCARRAQPLEQLLGGLAAAVGVPREERGQALGAERAGAVGAGVARQERERDRAVDVAEDPRGAGPEHLGRVIGIIGGSLGAIGALLSIGGSYPWWSLGIFALCVYVVHGLIVYGEEQRAPRT
jgi:hypothetical protein